MKLLISFKCPDAVDYAIQEYIEEQREIFIGDGGDPEDFNFIALKADVEAAVNKWVKWGEVVTIQISDNHAKVLRAN